MDNEHKLTRQEALEELGRYGIHGTQVYLIDLVPMIEMMWADELIQDIEIAILDHYVKHHVERINSAAEYPVLTANEARAFVTKFIKERPDPEYLHALRLLIVPIRLSSPDPEENRAIREFILSGCLDIGSGAVTHYPYQLTERFDSAEKRCFFDIVESLWR